jgi:hypothetical protein
LGWVASSVGAEDVDALTGETSARVLVVFITIGINGQAFIIEKVLSLSTLPGDAISTAIKDIIEDALCAIIEHICGFAVVGERHAHIVDVGKVREAVDGGGNAAKIGRVESIGCGTQSADEQVGIEFYTVWRKDNT